jgi:PST family polysaccharide transporter
LIDIVSLLVTIAIALGLAAAGFGYWALVANVVVVPVGSAIGAWLAAAWIPARPRRGPGIRRMVTYGGTVTLNSLIVYLAYNVDKVLLGRYWGAEALGIYGRAYQLMNLPTDSLNSTVFTVAFPALSRLQEDPVRLRRYFLSIYAFFLAVALPITVVCAFFAEDVVLVLLGPKWHETVPIFRLLAPTILVFALINPLGWLMFATAQMKRSLKIAVMIMVMSVTAYAIGLRSGPSGIALGFSTAMVLLMVPIIIWARHGTSITTGDLFKAILRPLGSVLLGAVAAMAMWPWISTVEPPLVRLTVTSGLVFGVHMTVLLFAFGERHAYSRLLIEAGIVRARQ